MGGSETATTAADRGIEDRGLATTQSNGPTTQRPPAEKPDPQSPVGRFREAVALLEEARGWATVQPPELALAEKRCLQVVNWVKGLVIEANMRKSLVAEHPLLDKPLSYYVGSRLCLLALRSLNVLVYEIRRHSRRPTSKTKPMSPEFWEYQLNFVREARISLQALNREYVSFELAEAMTLPDVTTQLPGLTLAQRSVLAWLRKYAQAIINVEKDWRLSRLAVAGAIAYEALENLRTRSPRSSGAGKIHVWQPDVGLRPGIEFAETMSLVPSLSLRPAIEYAELKGLVPKHTHALERFEALKNAYSSIRGVGAIMKLSADDSANFGFDLYCSAPLLTTIYTAWNPVTWQSHIARKAQAKDYTFTITSPMSIWVQDKRSYLEDGVGPEGCTPHSNLRQPALTFHKPAKSQ